jgi:hypothetical protein
MYRDCLCVYKDSRSPMFTSNYPLGLDGYIVCSSIIWIVRSGILISLSSMVHTSIVVHMYVIRCKGNLPMSNR